MSGPIEVRTNNVPRWTCNWHELSDAEKAEFDYLDTEQRQDDATFFRYKGQVWDLGEFVRTEKGGDLRRAGWIGVSSQSAFHAVVVKLANDGDQVVVGEVFA